MDRVKGKYLVLFIVLVCCSCVQNKKESVEHIFNIPYTVLTDSVYSRMPGRLLYSNNHIVWIDPFSAENFVHVLDAFSGKELGHLGNIGNGPNEFTAVFASLTYDSLLVLCDLNKDLQGYIDLNQVGVDSSAMFVKWTYEKLGSATRYLEIGKDKSLALCSGATKPIVYKHNGDIDSIGKFPFEEKIINGFSLYTGEMLYNLDKKCLFYSTYKFPYTVMYKLEDGKFVMDWEERKIVDYKIVKGKLKLDDPSYSFHEIALTKDYIVVAKRDKETEGELSEDIKKRDPMKALPYSLFLYNYDYELKKIIKLERPIIRVANNISCNTLYAIIVNPEFTIVKLELPI